MLYGQTIKGNKKVSTADLEPFYKQEANSKFLGLPIHPFLYIYTQGARFYKREKVESQTTEVTQKYDDKINQSEGKAAKVKRLKKRRDKKLEKLQKQLEEGNFLMRMGEAPTIFDSSLTKQTAEQMNFYLKSKGFFNGKVGYRYQLDTAKQIARISYQVVENIPYKVRDTNYVTPNPRMDSLLNSAIKESPIKLGDNYDEDKINSERERIDKIMKNNGYYNFSRQYVTFSIDSTVVDTTITDTTRQGHHVDITTIINKPLGQERHTLYRISDVFFTTDASTNSRSRRFVRDTTVYRRIHYLERESQYSKKVLNSKVLIRPGRLYSLENTIKTQQLLSSLDIFKFANIYYDTTGGKFVANIFTSPIEKYTYTAEGGGTVSQGLPGPFGSLDFKIRNVFGGLEIFEVRGTGSIEGQASVLSNTKVYASQEANFTTSLTFPRIIFPTPFKYNFNRYNPRTRLLAGYTYTNRPEYKRFNFKGSMSYTWQPDQKRQYTVTLIDVNRVYSTLTSDFKDELDTLKNRGSNLYRSFQKGFVSSVSASYTYNGNISTMEQHTNRARYLRIYAESGGTTLNFLNLTPVGIENDSLKNGLQFYRFVKLNTDFRYYIPWGKKKTWAFRTNVGVANAYGKNGTLPYEKFFFAGGSNSVRAWAPRRLGLGSMPDSIRLDGTYDYSIEQPGDILLEASAELRFDVISFLEGAFFVDAGNVWLNRPNKAYPNGNFDFNRFYKEIALGAGIGFRLDFSFLILRFDIATKVYDPGRPAGDRWSIRNIMWKSPFGEKRQTVLNLGIGYPF